MFGKLLETIVKIAATPVAVVADLATLGGACTDQDEPYTIKHLKDIKDTIDEIGD